MMKLRDNERKKRGNKYEDIVLGSKNLYFCSLDQVSELRDLRSLGTFFVCKEERYEKNETGN